jgi:protein SCO1/2
MKMENTNLQRGFGISLICIGLLFLLAGCQSVDEKPVTEMATVLPQAKKLTDFQLINYGAENFSNDSTKGQWSLFFFGYTRCPDVCPTELYMLAELMRRIEKNPSSLAQAPQVVFVSVDPQQDKPQALRDYAQFYHPSILGVTGQQSIVDQLTREMGVFYERVYHMDGKILVFDAEDGVPQGLENSYLINHSATIFLLNPDGDLHAVFSSPHDPDVMLRDLAAIQSAWN